MQPNHESENDELELHPSGVEQDCLLLRLMVKALVEHQRSVSVEVDGPAVGKAVTLRVSVAVTDRGRVIGKEGHTIRSLRTLMLAAGRRHGHTYTIDLC